MNRTHVTTLGVALLLLGLPLVGCQGGETDGTGQTATEEQTDAAAMDGEAGRAMMPPDTTAETLWAHLQGADYRASWSLWPGKDELYEGTEPHGMLLTTYANETASRALNAGNVTGLPEGSIIVKENYMPDSTFAAATVMMKVDGYNPEHQDWLFAKYRPDGTVDAFGRAQGCQSCHQQAEGQDYVYTSTSVTP